MPRLSFIVALAALIVAGLALLYPRQPALDQEAVAGIVRKVVADETASAAAPSTPAETAEIASGDTRLAATPEAATIGPIVRQYLLDNPEVLEEVIAALEAKRSESQADSQKQAVAENREALETPEFSTAAVGNDAGDVTLVEFFDYNCGYCKRMLPQLIDLIENDDKLRVVFREWPVLGEASQAAARVALGVRQVAPEKYFEFHRTLLSHNGRVGKDEAMAVARDLDIDTAALESSAASNATTAAIQENFRLGDALGLRGTPSYVVGDTVFMGAVPQEQIAQEIAELRSGE